MWTYILYILCIDSVFFCSGVKSKFDKIRQDKGMIIFFNFLTTCLSSFIWREIWAVFEERAYIPVEKGCCIFSKSDYWTCPGGFSLSGLTAALRWWCITFLYIHVPSHHWKTAILMRQSFSSLFTMHFALFKRRLNCKSFCLTLQKARLVWPWVNIPADMKRTPECHS